MTRRTLATLLLLFTAGCSSIYDEPLKSALDHATETGFKDMSRKALFDPYAAEVHAPVPEVDPIWKKTLDEVKSSGSSSGYTAHSLPELCDIGSCDTWVKDWVRPALREEGVPERWEESAVKQLLAHGWAIVQRDYASGDVHHGDYHVPAMVFSFIHFYKVGQNGARSFRYDFEILGKKEPVAAPPPAVTPPPSTPAPAGTVEERLLQLKKLRDTGIVTQEEYDRRRTEILNSL
jgi:hypothetical protein